MPKYNTVSVKFEHTLGGGSARRVNRAVLTVYGESEFAVLAELERQYPDYEDIVILECQFS
jgi:hypothetical protein